MVWEPQTLAENSRVHRHGQIYLQKPSFPHEVGTAPRGSPIGFLPVTNVQNGLVFSFHSLALSLLFSFILFYSLLFSFILFYSLLFSCPSPLIFRESPGGKLLKSSENV